MKSLKITLIALTLFGVAGVASGQTVSLEAQISALQAQIAELQAQIKALEGREQGMAVSSEAKELRLISQLRRGSQGEEVKVLQKILASDPSLYPEGLVTGFFGPLTELAVKRFQAKIKVEQVGEVGPQTIARINEILSAAGISGDVPSDLLNSRVKIEIKIDEDGKEEVKIEIKCDSSGSGNVCNQDDEDEPDDLDEDEDEEDDDDSDDSDDDESEDDDDEEDDD